MLVERVEVLGAYVVVECSGPMNNEDFLAALDRGLDVAAHAGRKAVLMDALNVHGTMRTMERFFLGDGIAHVQRAHGFVAAIAVLSNEPPMEAGRYAERVAIIRGAIGKSFTDAAEAERWITDHLARLSGPPGANP